MIKYLKYYCTLCGTIVDIESCCDNWCRKKTVQDISPQRFETAEQDLKILIELLKDK